MQDAPSTGVATSRLRMWGYAAVLAAMAFSQSAGRMVADTKFDLVTNPAKFLGNALHLWDPSAAFGQIQNQAYGYAWPMGPLFLLGDLGHVPGWVVQRLWWTLLLCAAFFGVVRLAQRLGLGTPLTQVVAGFAFVLTPRVTTLLGGTSIEIWPMALAPWVLVPLVVGSERGSVRRAAALSALVVASSGGVNAVAVVAVLPLGVLWILTRAAGPRKWRLLGWWTLFTGLATLWWAGPLLLMGRYSPPFLDYIENATITTIPTDLARTFLGQSDWVAYFAGIDYPAGQQLVTTPFLMLDAAVIAAFGLVGICLPSNPHQRFLTWGVLAGLTFVGFGYAGDLSGFGAADRAAWLDGPLAALRNLHKFDVVLRIPLILGLAHVLPLLPALVRGRQDRASAWAVRLLRAAVVLALLAMALPWSQDRIAPREGVVKVPEYWYDVADYLQAHDDGTVALEIPASAFGVYEWGNVHDDILQGLADSPWAVRNVIPLAQPGNVAYLDSVSRAIESGHPSPALAPLLAANGVGRLVVRNDLDRFQTGVPDPAFVRSVLDRSPGIRLAASFGPEVGSGPYTYAPTPEGRLRIVPGSGMATVTGSVDVYDVADRADALLVPDPQVLLGGPGSGLQTELAGLGAGPWVLAEDADGSERGAVLTDGNRRREVNFAAVRANQSATMAAGQQYRLVGPEHAHRFLRHPERWETTEAWAGTVSSVTASTSQAYADAQPPLEIGAHPGAALDRDPATEWRSARHLDPTGQWWQETFARPTSLSSVTITAGSGSAPVAELLIQAGDDSRLVPAPEPGDTRTYQLGWQEAAFLRITSAGRDLELPGSFALAEVEVPDVVAQRYLDLPVPDDRFPLDAVVLSRDPDRAVCAKVPTAFACDDTLIAPGEDGDTIARRFAAPYDARYEVSGTASLRRTVDASVLLSSGVQVTSDQPVRDVAEGPVALADGDADTTWVAQDRDETIHLVLPQPERLHRMSLYLSRSAAAALPRRIEVSADGQREVLHVGRQGFVRLPDWEVSQLDLRVLSTRPAYATAGRQFARLPAGITELSIDGRSLNPDATVERTFPCGTGPQLVIDDEIRDTGLQASTRELIRGADVSLRVCGGEVVLGPELTSVIAAPVPIFRAESVVLTAAGDEVAPEPGTTGPESLDVRRDERGDPVSVDVPRRSTDSVLALPQNLNGLWSATLDGEVLEVERMNGWMQGWRLPAGKAGTVRLAAAANTPFVALLGAGALGALLVLALAAWPRRRTRRVELPALVAGRPGPTDLVLVLGTGALLTGWWGLAGTAAALLLGRLGHRAGSAWGWLAGLALVVGALALGYDELTRRSWAVTWSQGWMLGAVCLVVAALAGRRVSPRQ